MEQAGRPIGGTDLLIAAQATALRAPFLDIRASIAIQLVANRVASFSVWRSDVTFR
jgi:hypothetical protein